MKTRARKKPLRCLAITALCVVTAIAIGAFAIMHSFKSIADLLGFDLKHIRVSNTYIQTYCVDIASLEELKALIGKAIFDVDLNEVANTIAKIDCIESVKVAKSLPFSLVIDAKARNPIAIFQQNKRFWFMSKDGFLMEIRTQENLMDFPLVIGCNSYTQGQFIADMLATHRMPSPIQSFQYVGCRRWDVRLKNGLRIMLPEQSPSVAWEKAQAMYDSSQDLRSDRFESVDLRVENLTYVKLKKGQS